MIDRENVINELEWIIDLFSNYERHAMGDEEMQSLNDAVVLLKAQDNDLISRAAAIDAIVSLTAFTNEDDIKKFVEEKACDDYFLGGICDAIDEIKNIAPVDAAPVKHGRWETFKDVLGFSHYQCSECGDEWRRDDKNEQGAFTMRYCPKCGSKNNGGV